MHKRQNIVLAAIFIFAFSIAITAYTNSSFIEEITSTKVVGILYAVASGLTIAILSKAMQQVGRYGSRAYFLLWALLHSASLLLLTLVSIPYIQIIAFVLYLLSGNMVLFSLDVFYYYTASKKGKGRSRGAYLLLGNTGWVIAPILGAFFLSKTGYQGTYLLVLGCIFILIPLVIIGLRKLKRPKVSPHVLHRSLRAALKNKSLRSTLIANFILQFFYAWMVVYTPIYLSHYLGIPWKTIGIIFGIMLMAFVILDYPLGKLADKIGSEEEIAGIGFLIMAGSVFALAYLPTVNIIAIGAILFMSRVGAAAVEAMTEIHFFRMLDTGDPRSLSLFRDLRPLSYLVAPLIGSVILGFTSFKHIFSILGIVLIAGYFIVLGMERKTIWWKRAHKE